MPEYVQILRVVVASPSDVPAERALVSGIVDDVNKSNAADRGLRLEAVQWETDSYPGFHQDGPQGLIDGVLRIEDCDLLIGIFWKRFGTATKDAQSGTEHELRLAYRTWENTGRPQIMVYFCQKPYLPQSKEETDQWGQLLEFRKAFPKEGLWWPYKGPSEFGKLLRTHLVNFIRDKYPVEQPSATRSPSAPADYFAVQTNIVQENSETFVGRLSEHQALERFLETHKRGYFIVRGGPGQGKTAFSSHLVNTGHYPHHFISRTGGRSDSRLILRSLIAQLAPLAKTGGQVAESISALTKTFEELLLAAAHLQKRLVLVIDALDELPLDSGGDPPYLPTDALPDGIFFVVTSRPGAQLDRLQQRLFAVPLEISELGPLALPEMRDILCARKPGLTEPQIERIAEASQGNALYLRAVADQLKINPAYDLHGLPNDIEGFFRSSTATLGTGNAILADVLGLLSVARAPFSLRELSAIMAIPQRELSEKGIGPIRQFLLETEGCYTFYHNRFHEFVTRTLLYEDELRKAHRRIADYLKRPENRANRYRLMSLAHHLFELGDRQEFIETIDETFLAEKVRAVGYAVLEDVELLTRCLFDLGGPGVVERCVAVIDGLRAIVGGDIVADAATAVRSYRAGPASFRSRVIDAAVPSVPGFEVYAGVLPKADVSADFFEVFPLEGRLIVAIGDAPSTGLKSAFAARFVSNLFRKTVESSSRLHLGEALAIVNQTICAHPYFERISMQCAEIDPNRGVVRIANAGHPYPVHYSARRRKCDILPIRGDLLNIGIAGLSATQRYEEFAVEFAAGDVLIFLTDGLTEAQIFEGDPYGYRFTEIVQARATEGARAIGEAVLDSWRAHPRSEDLADDVSLIAVTLNPPTGEGGSAANSRGRRSPGWN